MLIFVYAAMFASTNTLMRYIETVFSGKTFIESDDDPLWRYSLIDRYYPETKTVNYDLKRIYVFHNFSSGKIKVVYSLQYLDDNNKVLMNSNADATWYIKKVDGEWTVYDVEEKP